MGREVQVSRTWLRVAGGLVAFALIALVGLAALGGLDFEEALDTFAVVMVAAIPAGVAAYALIEYAQTRRIDSITRQFDTRTLVLMPVAMALNIVLGTAVASALKIPIYLDSIGTILVAALAGPLAGAATGFLSNVIWTLPRTAAIRQPVRGALRGGGGGGGPAGRHLRALGLAAPPAQRL